MAKIVSKKSYLSAVAKKLNSPKTKMLLQFGQTWNPNAVPIRDTIGMMETQRTVLRSAANLYDMTAGKVAFSQQMSNFSAGAATYEDVSDVRTVGAVDLTIIAMATSLVPFLCIDRGMSATDDTIFYNNLVAVNSAGGVRAGNIVSGNFNPPNPDVDLSDGKVREQAITAGPDTITIGANTLPKSVQVEFIKAGKVIAVGGDYAGADATGATGNVYINVVDSTSGIAATIPASAVVTYATGAVVFAAPTGTADTSVTVKVTGTVDSAIGQTATSGEVLIVEPQWTALPLKSEPHQIILQNNLMNMMYMSKVNALATGKAGNLYTDVVFQRVRNTYIESINAKIIRGMVGSVSAADVVVNLSAYNGTGNNVDGRVGTKNDLIATVVANMKAAMLAKSGCGMTSLVCNSVAVAMMELVPVLFVKAPNINAGINGLVGYFLDIPVYRHNSLDHMAGTIGGESVANTDAILFGAYRTADNTSGSQVYGEYLPFTNSGNIGNFAMPTQQANGFFSMVANKVVDPNLITFGLIKGGSNLYAFGAHL